VKMTFLMVLLVAAAASAQPVNFPGVKVSYNWSDKDPILVEESGVLSLDDAGKKLSFVSKKRSFEAGYDSVTRLEFDAATHARGGLLGGIVGGLVGAIIQGQQICDYWMFVEYTKSDGVLAKQMLEIPAKSWLEARDKVTASFGPRVSTAEVRLGTAIDTKAIKDKSKIAFNVDWKRHSRPEVKPDKALVVVVCTYQFALNGGRGPEFKIYANDQLILVNKEGTYGFAYLDPGEYQLVSKQFRFGSGIAAKLEGGKSYYFLQDIHGGSPDLSQHGEDLVMHELSGAGYAVLRIGE
jgi:hypothetical protein